MEVAATAANGSGTPRPLCVLDDLPKSPALLTPLVGPSEKGLKTSKNAVFRPVFASKNSVFVELQLITAVTLKAATLMS